MRVSSPKQAKFVEPILKCDTQTKLPNFKSTLRFLMPLELHFAIFFINHG